MIGPRIPTHVAVLYRRYVSATSCFAELMLSVRPIPYRNDLRYLNGAQLMGEGGVTYMVVPR